MLLTLDILQLGFHGFCRGEGLEKVGLHLTPPPQPAAAEFINKRYPMAAASTHPPSIQTIEAIKEGQEGFSWSLGWALTWVLGWIQGSGWHLDSPLLRDARPLAWVQSAHV